MGLIFGKEKHRIAQSIMRGLSEALLFAGILKIIEKYLGWNFYTIFISISVGLILRYTADRIVSELAKAGEEVEEKIKKK